ncbi:MAG: hypothetical protein CVT98_08405, partial [Bacteroidetes bacterium HGW-Bacteroidetes-15]
MKNLSFGFLFLLLAVNSIAQINISDSTVQVVGYWSLNESLTYVITNQKVKIQETDTIPLSFDRYEVDVTIIDSTSDSYTIKWHYRDYYIETDDEVMKRLSSIFEDMSLIIKTNEYGVFQEIVNWEEVKNFMLLTSALLKEEYKDIPNMDQLISQLEEIYKTKEAIESTAIDEIHQYYYFHGVKYKLLEDYHSQSKIQNRFGGDPFNAEITFWLDEINYDDNNSIFRMTQIVDSTELTNATFDYLSMMAGVLGTPPPIKEEFPPLTNEIRRASR